MGKLILNGRNYSGLVDAQGVFLDTDNIIVPETTYRGSLSYTATSDCYIYLYVANKPSDSTEVKLNGETIYLWWRSSVITDTVLVPVMKGQTLTVVNADTSYDGYYTVYGIQMGSQVTFLSEYASACYSTTEREVGCWIDGKPLYQKTLIGTYNSSATSLQIDVSDLDIDKIGNAFLSISSANYMAEVQDYYSSGSDHIRWYYEKSNNNITLEFGNAYPEKPFEYRLTIQYTKTTDVAGSGSWTPTATPTHHYSTDEQVIGTWTNGKPLYEKTYSRTGGIAIDTYGHISMPSDSIIRRFEGYAYRNNHASVDKFNGYVGGSDLYASIRSGDIEYWISNIFNPVEEIEFTVQYTKSTD